MLKIVGLCSVLLGLLACAPAKLLVNETYPGSVTSQIGGYDGLAQVDMKPAFVFVESTTNEVSQIKVGLRWSSADGGVFRLVAQINQPRLFKSSKDLMLKIDGVEYSLRPVNSNLPGITYTDSILIDNGVAKTLSNTEVVRKEYVISKEVVSSILNADRVVGRAYSLRGIVDFAVNSKVVDMTDSLLRSQLFSYQLKNFLKQVEGFKLQASTYQ